MIDINNKTTSIYSILKDIKKDKYNFELPVQRREGIWKPAEKSLFIDSILRNYPIYPALINKHSDTEKMDVVDFKQRFTTLRDFCNDKFKLSASLKPIDINGTIYEIAGKKFSALDDEVKDEFNKRQLSLLIMTDATPEEIADIFSRINMGHQLTPGQMRSAYESDAVRASVYEIADYAFIANSVGKAKIKSNGDRDLVRQTLMLIENGNGFELNSFRKDDMKKFIEYYNGALESDETKASVIERTNILKNALVKLNERYPDGLKSNLSSVPMIIYGLYKTIKDHKSTEAYFNWLDAFIPDLVNNEEYMQYCKVGTAGKDNVIGRYEYFRNVLRNLQ